MPDRPISSFLDRSNRKLAIVGLQFLKADQIRSRFLQPFEQSGEAAVYTVDVERGDFHCLTVDSAGRATPLTIRPVPFGFLELGEAGSRIIE